MTKFLMLGMPLPDVVYAATLGAAETIGWQDEIGTLGVGRTADIACFELAPTDVMLEDVGGQLRHCSERLVCRAVWKAGESAAVTVEPIFPNPESAAWQRRGWARMACKDATPPPELSAELQARMEAKQEEYAFLAGAMAKMGAPPSTPPLRQLWLAQHPCKLSCFAARPGDYSPNVPLYMTPASLGHLRRWASLPFCADAEGGAEASGSGTEPVVAAAEEEAADGGWGKEEERGARTVRRAVRRLIGYANTEGEQEELRLCALNGCC